MTMTDVATTGVVASARPGSSHDGSIPMAGVTYRPRTAPVSFLVKGSGLSVFTDTPTSALEDRTFDRTARTSNAVTSKAVTTQDPQPVSGEQLWSHPPV
jgi:hypothetical protein